MTARWRRAVRGVSAAILTGCLTVVLAALPSSGPAWASAGLTGGGSGFAALEISQWDADVGSPANGSLKVNYSSQSSGIGRHYFASNTWAFAASDIRYIPGVEGSLLAQLQSGRCGGRAPAACFQYVPVS